MSTGPKITRLWVVDLRFPTSETLDGSDATHTDPDYSAAYVVLDTEESEGNSARQGHGLTFTIGRGTEVVCACCRALAPFVVGRTLGEITGHFLKFYRSLTNESQLRWIGPEKGVMHLATAAVVNAIWDLWGKVEGKPVWQLVSEMRPEDLVELIELRYLSDVLTKQEALDMLRDLEPSRNMRLQALISDGYPAYTTSAGWLGYSDERITALVNEAIGQGWNHFKIKVGADLEDDIRRCRLIRRLIGPSRTLMTDANQRWDVPEAIEWMQPLAEFDPMWIEEPTSPDDVLGHRAIAEALRPLGIGVATGEMCQNRVMFKQFMQAGAMDVCQIDSCRLGSINEILAVQLMAAKLGVPVCPHAGGVGLCQYVNHLIMLDYIAISGTLDNRVAEYVSHLHEHFVDPWEVRGAAYRLPSVPGYGITIKPASLEAFAYPGGEEWERRLARKGAIHA